MIKSAAYRTHPHRRGRRLAVLLLALTAAAAALVGTATAPAAARSGSTNPLAGGTWGVYTGNQDGIYPAWEAATGTNKRLLAKIALRPRVRWYGSWIKRGDIRSYIHDDIVKTQNGDPNTLVQVAIFRLWPRGESHKDDPLTLADQSAYRAWIDAAARGIGNARVAMILEPDLGVSLTGWRPAVRLRLARYAAQVFGKLPRTSVYLDAASPDWLTVDKAKSMVIAAGVRYTRGFALNATHYTSTPSNIDYGRSIGIALAHAGLPGKHFVVNTADTGRPFTGREYWAKHPNGNFNNAEVCLDRTERRCVTLGIPPTSNVAAAAWQFSATINRWARNWCDAYLWYGRPWLHNQASPFDLQRSLQIARTTPY
jgi:hypothetical protein